MISSDSILIGTSDLLVMPEFSDDIDSFCWGDELEKLECEEPKDKALCWILWWSNSLKDLWLIPFPCMFLLQLSFDWRLFNFGEFVFLLYGNFGKFENDPSLWIIFTIDESFESSCSICFIDDWWSSWWLLTDTYWHGILFPADKRDDIVDAGYSNIESISDFTPQPEPNETLCPENEEDFLL